MIVGDDECGFRARGDLFDPFRPRTEFLDVITIVITFVAGKFRVIGKPRVASSSVEANISDFGSGTFAWAYRTADYKMIDVTKSEVEAVVIFHRIS